MGALGYLVARSAWFAGVAPRGALDTASYLRVAHQPLWSLGFWAGERLWGLPLFYKVLPDSNTARTVGQLVVSLVAWAVLAAVVARRLPAPAWRIAGFVCVLLFSMSLSVIRWDRYVLSESLAISLTALLVAAWIEFVASPRMSVAAAIVVLSAPWAFTRDTNGPLLLVTAVAALVWAAWRGPHWRVVSILGVALAAVVALQFGAAGRSIRLPGNDRPMLHVIGRRVLDDPAQTRFFLAHGMPRPSARVLRGRSDLAGFADDPTVDPATARFFTWAARHGRSTLAIYLVTHPVAATEATFDARRMLFASVSTGYLPAGTTPILPDATAEVIVALAVAGAAVWTVRAGGEGTVGRAWIVPIALLVLQVPHAVLVYHGDTLEIPRHGIVMAISARLAILLLALVGAAAGCDAVRRRRSRAAGAGS